MELSRSIYEHHRASRYFSEASLREHLKTVAYDVYVSGKNKTMEKMISWQAMVGWFESSRAEAPLTLVSFIIFVSCLIIKTRELVQW